MPNVGSTSNLNTHSECFFTKLGRHQTRPGPDSGDTASGSSIGARAVSVCKRRLCSIDKLTDNRRTNNTYLFNQTATCQGGSITAKCIAEHGGGFNEASSSSWSILSSFVSPESVVSGLDSAFGADTLSFGGPQNLTSYSLGIIQTSAENNPIPFDNVLGLGSNSTFLNTLSSLGLIASRTISIFSGMAGTNGNMDGSLVIGGYDSAKFFGTNLSNPIQPQNTNPVSGFTNTCGTGLLISVQDISLNLPDGSTSSILGGNFSTGLSMCIDPAYPGITLPPNTGPIIQSMIGDPITYANVDQAGDSNVPFYNSFIYPASDVYVHDSRV